MKSVTVSGKKYPIRPNMWAQVQFCRDRGKPVSAVAADDIEGILYYAYLCIRGTAFAEGKDFSMDFETFLRGVEGDPVEPLLQGKMDEVKKKESLLTLLKRSLWRLVS